MSSFKDSLKSKQNAPRIEKELRTLEVSSASDFLSDSLYRKLSKVPPAITIKLDFFSPVQWYSSKLATLDNVVIMFMMDDIAKILNESHKLVQSVRTRINTIKYNLAEEYQLGMTLLSPAARKTLNHNAVKRMTLKFIVFSTQTDAVLWIKSDIHGGEYLKVMFDSKTGKTTFDI